MANRFMWRHQYDDDFDELVRMETRTINLEPALTQQHHAESADLNIIVARFGVKDVSLPAAAQDANYYGDFTDVPDFRQALDNTREAIDRFSQLPAPIRARFNNDPVELYAFVTNEANVEESVKLGLLTRSNLPVIDTVPLPPIVEP